jgi:hypothetical protein
VTAACAQGALTSDSALVKTTNTSALAFYIDDRTTAPADTQSVSYQDDVNPLTSTYLNHLANSKIKPGEDDSTVAYAQGTILTTKVPLNADVSDYTLNYSGQLTSAVFLLNNVGQILDVAGIPEFVSCVYDIPVDQMSASTIIDCASAAAKALGSSPAAEKLARVGRILNVFVDGRALSETIGQLLLTVYNIHTDRWSPGASDLYIQYKRGAIPVIDANGNFVPPQCWTAVGATWQVDQTCYQAYIASLPPIPSNCVNGGTIDPQCQTLTDPGNAPDSSGCWQWDALSQAWVLNANDGASCLEIDPSHFCGVGSCVPWPDSSNHVVKTSDGASWFIDARGGLWHLHTTDAYFSCTSLFPLLTDPETSDGKWQPDAINPYPYQGERYGC